MAKKDGVWALAGWAAAMGCTFFLLLLVIKGLALGAVFAPGQFIAAARQTITGGGEVPVWQQFAGAVLTFGNTGETGQATQAQTTVQNLPAPEGTMPIIPVTYGPGTGVLYIKSGAGYIKNCTELSAATVAGAVMQPLPFHIEFNSSEPQVLIMHTHATECYQPGPGNYYDPAFTCRTTDETINEIRVGAEMAAVLNAAGIYTLQDNTLHDYPSYNGSYARSRATVEAYLAAYPSIKVVLDIHRDAIEKEDGTRVKPLCTINGEAAAQIMIICGADSGDMGMPNYMENLKFAARLQNAIELAAPGITRPILFDYRNYNQQLTTGSLLIEIGGHANTLEEALVAARYVANGLVNLAAEGW